MSEPHRPHRLSPFVLAAALVAGGGLVVGLGSTWASSSEIGATGSDYIADQVDSICGLDDVDILSKPARVRLDDLMDATAERQRMMAEGIDPTSAQGQLLETDALRRVQAACRAVMTRLEHCSVWKKIARRDRVQIPDITSEVLAALSSADPESKTIAGSR